MGCPLILFAVTVSLSKYTMSHKKRATRYSFITSRNVGRFLKFRHVGLSRKFATRFVPYDPPHLKRVTTLPCEIQKINNCNAL